MDKKHKHSSKKSDTLRNSRTKWPSRSKSFSEAVRIPSGRDRSPLKTKLHRVCAARRLTGGITLRKRKRHGAYYRLLSGARLRRARKGLATRRVSKLQIVRLLVQCAPLQDRSVSVVAQAKQHWGVLSTIKTRKLRALPLTRHRRAFADDAAYTATTGARRLALRAKVHLHRSAQFSGQRRVLLVQQRIKGVAPRRAVKQRLRRVRPKTKFRYFGVFGKRRRRVERRDKFQLMRLVRAVRRRVAARGKTRALRVKVRTDVLRAQRSLVYTAAQAPHVTGVITSSQRLRLLRAAASNRVESATRRYQQQCLLATAHGSHKKGLNMPQVTSKSSAATNLTVRGVGVQKNRKDASHVFLKGRLSPLLRALRPRFGVTAGISLPFRRSLRRAKILFIGRSPAISKLVVEPPAGPRKYWRKVTRRNDVARRRRQFAKWRRAVLRGYSSRGASKCRNFAAQLSRRAESYRRGVDTRGYYDISLRPSVAIAGRGLAELRRRSGSARKVVNGSKAPFYATPRGVLGALQTSRRRLKVASRATVRATHVADTLNAFALRQAVAGVGAAVSRRLASERARCVSAVELRLRRLFEKRLYRRQLKLRLPRTNVSRKNLRHGGHVLFARNALKAPATLEGKRNQMLAPTISWAINGRSVSASTSLLPAQFRRIEKRGDALPRAWKRPPSFLNSLRASRQRERRKALSKRRLYYATRRLARHAARRALTPRPCRLPSLRARLAAVGSAVAGLRESTSFPLSAPVLARLTAYQNYLEQQARADAACTQTRSALASGVIARTIFKKLGAASTAAGRIAAEKHVQSVRHMLKAERGLSAWSPLYPLKWRRWSSPRAEGLPLPRTWASHKTLRQRALLNESLTYRGLPERRYVDLSYSHLQYYRGSAAGIGYARFRRAYRPRSLHNRWWKPVNYSVPFENPYSRRALNATKYIAKQFTAEALPRAGARGTEARTLQGEFYPVRYPPTNIPWRNYKFRKPKRRAAPYNIQRWARKLAAYATVGRGSYHQVLTLRQSKHAVRRLERLFPQTAVWADRRWESLDPSTASTAESRLLETALISIPLAVWSTLRRSVRSAERYAVLRQGVFNRFRQWSRASLIPGFVGGRASAVQQAHAVKYLHEQITAVTAALSNGGLTAFGGQFSSNQLLGLEQHSYARQVQSKKDRFWTKRQLPRIQKECTSDTLTVLARENVPLYKRWLHGAGRYLRHSQSGHLPTAHDHNAVKHAVNLGRRRLRFPASGRRRASYDSMLHAFTRRTSPARFRRVDNVRFQALAPLIVNNFKVNQTVYEQSRALRRRRVLSSQLSRAAYLSPVWRELLAQRSSTPVAVSTENSFAKVNVAYPSYYGQPRGLAAKRRFASLPITAVFKHAAASARAVRSVVADPTRAARIALLRCALRRRRMERTIFDLKKHALARRLPKEQVLPPWRSRRSIQRRRRYASAGDWGATALKRRPTSSVFWTLHHLGSVGPRLEDRAKATLPANYYGEVLRLPLDVPKVTRKGWSRVGFCITPKLPQKLRRRKTDSHLRQRRRRRLGASDMSMTRFNHWSERPQLLKLHRASSGRVGPLLTRFARRLIRTMRNRRNGRIASTFARKGLLRSDLPHQRLVTRALHQKRLVALQERARELAALGTAITSKELYAATPLYRSGKARQLISSAIKHRSKLQALQAAAHRRSSKKQTQHTSAAEAMSATEGYVGRRFVESLPVTAAAAPLFFQNHTKTIVKTEATIERERLANIASKELRYKITAQYAEGLTSFIPSLISQMISRRTKTQKLTRRNVKRIVSSTYWSLRVYLNVDPFDARFYLRDGNYEFRSSLEQEMLVRAKGQNTEQPQRAALRRRFQPGRLHLAHNSDRFRFDWLRTFFPLKHSLFQEDPDDYGNLPIATARLRRLMPSGYGIYNWETAGVTPSLETRSRQVLTLRYSRATPRVETMLQGARRLPIAESPLSGAVTVGASGAVGSFFARSFSSYAHRATALVGRLIYQRKRFTGADDDSAPTFIAVAGRYRVKSRVEARGRTNFSFSSKGTMVGGALDPRFLRYKSPRSRQYLLRLPESFTAATAEEKRTRFATYRARRQTLAAANTANWTRTSRRTFAFNPVAGMIRGKVETTLQNTRDGYSARRSPAHLESQMLQAQAAINSAVFNDFHTRRKSLYSVWATRAVRRQLREAHYYRGVGRFTREQAATNVQRALGRHLAVESSRSILQYRTPMQRSLKLEHKAERVIAETPFELAPRAARYARRWRDLFGHNYIFLQTRRDVRTRAAFKKQLGLKARAVASTEIRPAAGLVLGRRALGRYRKLPRRFATLRRKFFAKLPRNAASAGELSVLNSAPLKRVSTRTNFSLRVGGRISARASISKEALEIEVIRRRTPFEVYRPKLWHKLTNRWMKRERTMRFWLKDTKRWLRDPWLSEIVACRPKIKGKRPAGELALVEQQIGEYVPEVDSRGIDIPEDEAVFREREEFVAGVADKAAAIKPVRRGPRSLLAVQRRAVSVEARKKPIPTLWLANHEYRGVLKEVEENLTKTPLQRVEEEQAKVKEYWRRKKAGLPQPKERRLPLKHPADHWLPATIWREIQRRARRLEWRESDELFFRKGFRNAFRFFPGERNRAPWLEALMYNRSLFSTRRGEFRRRQFPREQKKYKWLQRVRKAFFPSRSARYIKGRRWPRLRMYNQKLFYSLFNLPDRRAASRHFRKLNRRKGKTGGFAHSQTGLGDRLDVTLMHLNLVPTIFWARVVAPHGLLRVNGKIVKDPAYRLSPGDFIQLEQERILRFRHFFKPVLNRRDEQNQPMKYSSGAYPANFTYYPGLRSLVYNGLPKESELRRSNRLNARLFRWFKLDSV